MHYEGPGGAKIFTLARGIVQTQALDLKNWSWALKTRSWEHRVFYNKLRILFPRTEDSKKENQNKFCRLGI